MFSFPSYYIFEADRCALKPSPSTVIRYQIFRSYFKWKWK